MGASRPSLASQQKESPLDLSRICVNLRNRWISSPLFVPVPNLRNQRNRRIVLPVPRSNNAQLLADLPERGKRFVGLGVGERGADLDADAGLAFRDDGEAEAGDEDAFLQQR